MNYKTDKILYALRKHIHVSIQIHEDCNTILIVPCPSYTFQPEESIFLHVNTCLCTTICIMFCNSLHKPFYLTHTHTYIYIYTYIFIYVFWPVKWTHRSRFFLILDLNKSMPMGLCTEGRIGWYENQIRYGLCPWIHFICFRATPY